MQDPLHKGFGLRSPAAFQDVRRSYGTDGHIFHARRD